MMTYAYNAALYCDDCGHQIRVQLDAQNVVNDGDTEKYPQWCGGEEADSPQHCDGCEVFLENALTAEGNDYLLDMVLEALATGRVSECVTEWVEHYDVTVADLLKRAKRSGDTE